MLGHVPLDDLPRWYNACDLFVLANRDIAGDTEGFGIVYLEAAACGKASIAGKAGGTGSAVLDGVTGIRVNADTSDDLRAAMLALLNDSGKRDVMSAAGLSRARASLSWEAIAQQTRNLSIAIRR